MRGKAGYSPSREGPSDFFYHDEGRELARFLFQDSSATNSSPKTFLMEVKSSVGQSNIFHMSQNQFNLVSN